MGRWLTLALFAAIAIMIALPTSIVAQVVPPCTLSIAGTAYCFATPSAYDSGSPAGPNGRGVLPATSAVSTVTEQADRAADSMLRTNTSMCLSANSFGATPNQMDIAEQIYVWYFRHIRDGIGNACYNSTKFDTFVNQLCTYAGIDILSGEVTTPTTSDLSPTTGLLHEYPCLAYLASPNEIDSQNQFKTGTIKTAAAYAAGTTSLSFGTNVAHVNIVAGYPYVLDTGTNAETVTFSTTQSDPTTWALAGGASLQKSHASSVGLYWSTDFAFASLAWYQNIAPLFRAAFPTVKITGPSMAQTVNGYLYTNDGIALGQYIDVMETHAYPNTGRNAEGIDGSHYLSDISTAHPPCSHNNKSYAQMMIQWCAPRLIAGAQNPNVPVVATEFSWDVCPDGGAPPTVVGYGCINDATAVDYVLGEDLAAYTHGLDGIYHFQLKNGTSGPSSGFCPYGFLEGAECLFGNGSPNTPYPKPELLALLSIAQMLTDPNCKYPGCQYTPTQLAATWSAPALPLNTAMFGLKPSGGSATFYIAYWLGSESYDTGNLSTHNATCEAVMGCAVAITPVTETLTLPQLANATSVQNIAIDDTAGDPTPIPTATTLPNGATTVVNAGPIPSPGATNFPTPSPATTPAIVQLCPSTYVSNYEGCPLAPTTLTPSGSTVSLTAKRQMQILKIVVPSP